MRIISALPMVMVAAVGVFFLRPVFAQDASAPVTVGDPSQPELLGKAVIDAYANGARNIVVAPGTYVLPEVKDAHFNLTKWQDAAITGTNVTIIINNTPKSHDRIFYFDHCRNVTIDGFNLSQSWVTSLQGHITAVGKDEKGEGTFDWTPAAGFPLPEEDKKEFWISIVDGQTHELKTGENENYHAHLEKLGEGSYRFHWGSGKINFDVGDIIISRYGDAPNKIFLDNSHDCTIKNVIMSRNGFAPIFESSGGGNHLLNVKWTQGPRPEGANEDTLVTNAADGIHSANANPGPDIEGCTFEGIFLDDCIAIHGGLQSVKSVNGSTLTVENGWAMLHVGEPIRISNEKGFYLQANVTSLKDNHNGTTDVVIDDSTSAVPVGSKVSNPLWNGQGYKIIGNRLGHTRSRGIIVKADNGVIKDNIIENCSLGLRIGGEWWCGEADYSQNVVVEGNTFVNNGLTNGGYVLPALMVDGNGEKQNTNIRIQNNTFTTNYSGDIMVKWADGVEIKDNKFTPPADWPKNTKPRKTIYLDNSTNLTLSNSQVQNGASYAQPPLEIGKDIDHLTKDDSIADK